jgi:hypothetical protein
MPTIGALVAGVIIGLALNSYLLGRSSPAAAATGGEAANGGELITTERFAEGIEGSGWQPIGGEWTFENGNLVQRETEGYDRAIAFNQTFSEYVFRVGLTQLEGSGGGLLFNMPHVDRKNGAHMVRYTDEGSGVFWGHYDQDGTFVGQGFAPTLPAEKKTSHVLEILVGANSYTVRMDGRVLGQDVPLVSKAGHVGLTNSVSAVAFDSATVLRPDGELLGAPDTADNGETTAAPTTTDETPVASLALPADGNLLSSVSASGDLESAGWTSFSGEWAFTDGALTQSQVAGFDRGIGYQGTFSDYTLSTTLRHLEGTGGGVLFNMPQPDRKNGAHMVRFSEDGKAVFWGYYDANGDFTGQGSGDVAAPGTEAHTIEIRVGTENYTVLVDGQTIVENVPLQSQAGHVGLTSSESVVAFESVQVKPAIE